MNAHKPSIFLSIAVAAACFLSAALCPLVLFVLWGYLPLTEHLSLEWASRVQTNSFWVYEGAIALVAVLALRRGTAKLYRQAAGGAFLGSLLGVAFGLWINKVAVEGLPMVGP